MTLRALVGRGLRDQARAPLTWGGALGLMGALIAAIWPSIEDSIGELVRRYPEGLKQAFGISELDSVEAYVGAEMLSLIVPLAVAFFAVRCVVRSTAAAEEHGFLDTLLSLPISRRALMASTLLVTAVVTLGVLAMFWGLTWVAGTIAGTGISASKLAAGAFDVWPLSMAFAGLAALVVGFTRRSALVTEVACGTLIAMYVVDLVGKLSDTLEPVRAVSAFRYYGSAIQDGLDVSHVAGLTLAAVVLGVAGALLFERRDVV